MQKIIIKVFLLYINLCGASKSLKCHLEWKQADTGGRLPDNLIEIHGNRQYAARGRDFDGNYVVGTFDPAKRKATFPFENDNSTATVLVNFELLTNPHGCIVSMPQFKNGNVAKDFNVETGGNSNAYVGRALFNEAWYAGQIVPTAGGISIAAVDTTEFLTTYQVLTSHSSGLQLEVSEFKFDEEPFGGQLDYMGVEQINNNAEVTITQKVQHVTKIVEITTLKTFKETTSERTITSGFNMVVVGVEKKVEHTYRESVEEEFTTIKETEMGTTYELIIPPNTRMVACSTVAVVKNITEQYGAKGVYKAASLSPREIQDILKDSGVKDSTIVGDEVVVNIRGLFKGNVAMSSQFVAVEVQDGVAGDCFAQQELLFQRRKELMVNAKKYWNEPPRR